MKKLSAKTYGKYAAVILMSASIAFLGTTLAVTRLKSDKAKVIANEQNSKIKNIKPDKIQIKGLADKLRVVDKKKTLAQTLEDMRIGKDIPDLRVEVYKKQRILTLFSGHKKIAAYSIGLGLAPTGHKLTKGDGKTPEGEYIIVDKYDNNASSGKIGGHYLKINYPNVSDAKTALKDRRISRRLYRAILSANNRGRIPPQNTILGGGLGIHAASGPGADTKGCVGLLDKELAEIYDYLKLGTPVIINP